MIAPQRATIFSAGCTASHHDRPLRPSAGGGCIESTERNRITRDIASAAARPSTHYTQPSTHTSQTIPYPVLCLPVQWQHAIIYSMILMVALSRLTVNKQFQFVVDMPCPTRSIKRCILSIRLSVCPSVCFVPGPNARTESRINFKLGRGSPWQV